VLKPGRDASRRLADELRQYVERRLSANVYPREIEFMEQLPKTPAGKVRRFLRRIKGRWHWEPSQDTCETLA
jgi:acetyl-CoA synthetase